jgi:hypothetical protein
MKDKYDKDGFAIPEIHQKIGNHLKKLFDEYDAIKMELDKGLDLLQKDMSKTTFNVNGVDMSLAEFTILLGQSREFPRQSIRSFFATTVSLEKGVKEITASLANISVARIPTVPEDLIGWLELPKT